VLIALGSNLGDRRGHLDDAVDELAALEGFELVAVSPWIETDPVGGPPGQGRFLNGALEARTALAAGELLAAMQRIEAAHGRRRGERDAPRTLDLDLLFYGREAIDEPGLVVPHPRLEERLFVLEPLACLRPELRLARSGKSVRERVAELSRAERHG